MTRIALTLALLSTIALPLPALAQDNAAPAPSPSERRLTPEQVEEVLAQAAARRTAAEWQAAADSAELDPLPSFHGEVGVTIGTGGYHSVYGSALYPMGRDGFASISMSVDDWDRVQR